MASKLIFSSNDSPPKLSLVQNPTSLKKKKKKSKLYRSGSNGLSLRSGVTAPRLTGKAWGRGRGVHTPALPKPWDRGDRARPSTGSLVPPCQSCPGNQNSVFNPQSTKAHLTHSGTLMSSLSPILPEGGCLHALTRRAVSGTCLAGNEDGGSPSQVLLLHVLKIFH